MVHYRVPALSPHLFWDTDPDQVDFDRHASWLVKRVLEYGRWRDWQLLVRTYGKARLAEIVPGIRSLDPRAASFARTFLSLPSPSTCSNSTPSPQTSGNC